MTIKYISNPLLWAAGLAALTLSSACGDDGSAETSAASASDSGDTDPADTDPAPEDTDPSDTDGPDPGDTDPSDTDGPDPDTDTDTDGDGVCFDSEPAPEDGSVLDFGDWGLSGGLEGYAEWSGACTIVDVVEGEDLETTLDCSADPDGPASVLVTFASQGYGAAWQAGQAVDVHYTMDDWNDGEHFVVRASEDAGLLFVTIYGGSDGGLPLSDEDLAPFSATYDLEFCDDENPITKNDNLSSPAEVTFHEPDGDAVPMIQGQQATLDDADAAQYQVVLHEAEYGMLTDHYGSYVDVVVHRLPAE